MTPILELVGLRYSYPGRAEPALMDASLRVELGRRVALLGRNGSGKSTLLLHCNGVLRPDRGSVHLHGSPVSYDRRGLLDLRRQVGIVFQNPDDQLFSASVAQDISFGPLNLGLSDAAARVRVAEAAELCGVVDLLDRPTHALSLGQKARVALAGVLAMEPRVLIADEVTASLDQWMRQQVFDIFDRLVADGRTVVWATHEVELARDWADWIVVLAAGRVVAEGEPRHVLADDAALEHVAPRALWSRLRDPATALGVRD